MRQCWLCRVCAMSGHWNQVVPTHCKNIFSVLNRHHQSMDVKLLDCVAGMRSQTPTIKPSVRKTPLPLDSGVHDSYHDSNLATLSSV